MPPAIVVTPGDPRGIGPEVVLGALARFRTERPDIGVTVVGPEGDLSLEAVAKLAEAYPRESTTSDAQAGAFAAGAIERAVELARRGPVRAVVTGPVHKPSLHAAGWRVPGQTEMLRDLTGAARVGMLMAAERTRVDAPLRVLLATTHIPLRDVPSALTAAVVQEQVRLLDAALRSDWGIAAPRIGMCGLNPHASDGGLFGDEEATTLEPALDVLRAEGVCVDGPLPADTVFTRALAGAFDAVVAPYHDVGMAAFKTVSFGTGVNVTLGLPFVRTSPDHGTGFDIAGTGTADASSTLEALRLAAKLAERRF